MLTYAGSPTAGCKKVYKVIFLALIYVAPVCKAGVGWGRGVL